MTHPDQGPQPWNPLNYPPGVPQGRGQAYQQFMPGLPAEVQNMIPPSMGGYQGAGGFAGQDQSERDHSRHPFSEKMARDRELQFDGVKDGPGWKSTTSNYLLSRAADIGQLLTYVESNEDVQEPPKNNEGWERPKRKKAVFQKTSEFDDAIHASKSIIKKNR